MGIREHNDNYYETDKFVFFFGSYMSQWALRDIVIEKVTYNCCEQFMMACKAVLFKDVRMWNKIMGAKDPAMQKKYGRMVENFDEKKWNKVARDIVYKANYAKFTQHEDLKEKLIATGDKTIVEASPCEAVWGVRLRATDKRILDPKNWQGTNWLGLVIMKVSDNIE